ncbi:glycosyltransferase [Thermosyntropha sp.]|uniref:glycosyltransferase family 2 protein n=1 Tax=Thermosyntropha sp. TaxID=2740820 RepID=UPI0025F16C78|nr:glycosyltransferase [Thermosyntropha sp.]MBO8159576.1 glycosyltransferase family 2 protein [Thermosyntropha sp.]
MQELTRIDLLFLIALSATWILLLYHVFLTYGGYRCFLRTLEADEKSYQDIVGNLPFVTVLVPAHNEEMVIGRTVDAICRSDYPKDKLEVIVINDSSTDKTGEILEKKQKEYSFLKVVTLKPPLGAKGKSNALNNGFKAASGEYIIVYDADNTPERKAIRYLVSTIISDPRLGAVVGKFRTRNRDVNLLTRFINLETISFQWLVQAGRYYWFRLTTITGTNFIIRRDILEKVGGWRLDALTEDTELTIRVYNEGYYIKWIPEAVTWEQEPENLKVWLKQRTRWARGNMWVISYYIRRIFSLKRKISWDVIYFFFTYAIFFTSVIISDAIFILGITGLAKLSITGPFVIIWIMAYILFIIETFISLSLERGEGNFENFLLTALMYFTYCQLWLYLVFRAAWIALKDKITGKGFYWYKTERSAR